MSDVVTESTGSMAVGGYPVLLDDGHAKTWWFEAGELAHADGAWHTCDALFGVSRTMMRTIVEVSSQ
jgi:hypothetical protein